MYIFPVLFSWLINYKRHWSRMEKIPPQAMRTMMVALNGILLFEVNTPLSDEQISGGSLYPILLNILSYLLTILLSSHLAFST